MVRIPSIAATLAAVLLLLGGTQARCDFIPWRIDPGFGSPGLSWSISGIPNEAGNIASMGLTVLSSPTQSGSARIGLVRVSASESPAGADFPNLFSNARVAGDYRLSLFLIDEASQRHTTLTFAGDIRAQIIPHHQPGAFVVNHFLRPTTQSARLGKNVYTVSLDPFTFASSNVYLTPAHNSEPFLLAPDLGTMSAFVDVHPAANNTPEPSCLALAGLGLGCLAGARLLRRRCRPALATP